MNTDEILYCKVAPYRVYQMTAEGTRDHLAWPEWLQDYFIFNAVDSKSKMTKENGVYWLHNNGSSVEMNTKTVLVMPVVGHKIVHSYHIGIFNRDFAPINKLNVRCRKVFA